MKFLFVLGRSICVLGLMANLAAQEDPDWWDNVIRSGDDHSLEANYTPANLGQLKHFAAEAVVHLEDKLSGDDGAGAELRNMVSVSNWPSEDPANYAPLSIGQLKNVADKFYARLDAVGFDYRTQLIANGYGGPWTAGPLSSLRPWDEAAPIESNYAVANLGQLKILFSFDLSDFGVLPDWWQTQHFGSVGHNPNTVTADGQTLMQEFQNGTDPNKLDHPLVGLKVQVIVR